MGRPKGSKNKEKFSEETKEQIVKLYQEDRIPLYKLQERFHTSSNTIKKILEEYEVPIRTFRDSKRLYPLDEDFFSKIDTPEKAYWLGFMYADGCIRKGSNGQYLVKLSLRDKDSIILLQQSLKTSKPIGEYINSGSFASSKSIMYSLEISSEKLFNGLLNNGCVENKTFKLKFPSFLEENLISHFIRGYFDGDGSVFEHFGNTKKDNTRSTILGCTICGIHSFLKEMLNYLRTEVDITDKVLWKDPRKDTDCWAIRLFSNKRCFQFYNYIYKDCGQFYMKRKRDIFEKFIKDKGSETIITSPKD